MRASSACVAAHLVKTSSDRSRCDPEVAHAGVPDTDVVDCWMCDDGR